MEQYPNRRRGNQQPTSKRGPNATEINQRVQQAVAQNQGAPLRTFGNRPIVIGVPARDLGAPGAQRAMDKALVEFGTGARVVIIDDDEQVENVKHFDALFVPGVMFDLPGTIDDKGKRLGNNEVFRGRDVDEDTRANWLDRHQLQSRLIQGAIKHNVPVLGVCGGSWSLAQEVPGGSVQYMGDEGVGHNRPFNQPWKSAHPVRTEPGSMLDRIVKGGDYLNRPSSRPEGHAQDTKAFTPPGASPVDTRQAFRANSMHWSAASFANNPNAVEVGAREGRVLEGWNMKKHAYFVGVQWHPEFAQLPLDNFEGATAPHRNVMNSLGQAALENRAARVIQRRFRERQAARQGGADQVVPNAPPQVVANPPAKVVSNAPPQVVANPTANVVSHAPANVVAHPPPRVVANPPANVMAPAPAPAQARTGVWGGNTARLLFPAPRAQPPQKKRP